MALKTQHRTRAVTLVEVLVVMSTTALLLGVLLPSLRAARAQTRSTVCLSNLRQMAIAAQNYTHLNDEYYPPAYLTERIDGVQYYRAWDFTSWRVWKGPTAVRHVKPGFLWMGLTIGKVQQCPSYRGDTNAFEDPYSGYNYNISFIGRDETTSPVGTAKTTEVRHPAQTVLFGDGQYEDGANKFMRAPYGNPRDASFSDAFRHAGVQGFRHLGQTNAAFCDGSVRSLAVVYTETETSAKAILDKHNGEAKVAVGFLSPDNRLYDLD